MADEIADEVASEPGDGSEENADSGLGCGCLGCCLIILLDLLFAVAVYFLLQSCN